MAEHFDLVLTSSGDGWMGTFALTVAFVAEDILSDGEPFPARLSWEIDGATATHDVLIVAVDRALSVLTIRERDGRGQADIPLEDVRELQA